MLSQGDAWHRPYDWRGHGLPVSIDCDAIIIGAGCAGLAAARDLVRAGLKFIVLEARNRVGGRVYTLTDVVDYPIELGAEFIHGSPREIMDLVESFNSPLKETSWQHWNMRAGKLLSGDSTWSEVEAIMETMHKEEGKQDRSFRQFLNEVNCSDEARSAVLGYVEGYNAASADKISVQGLIQSENASEEAGEDGTQFRFVSGYSQLIDGFLKDLPKEALRLEHAVKGLKWSSGLVEVLCKIGAAGNRRYSAKAAIITLPLGVLQASEAVRFVPPLTQKSDALNRLVMGKAVRVALLFKGCFWQDITLSQGDAASLHNLGFVHCDDEYFPTWWTQWPLESPMLIAWASGHYAEKMEFETDDVVAERALNALCNWLPVDRSVIDDYLLGWRMHNWQTDPYSLGAYSYPAVGGLEAQKELAAPVDGTLFFAGEATDTTGNFGTVHGAIATGQRAAKELLDAIR